MQLVEPHTLTARYRMTNEDLTDACFPRRGHLTISCVFVHVPSTD